MVASNKFELVRQSSFEVVSPDALLKKQSASTVPSRRRAVVRFEEKPSIQIIPSRRQLSKEELKDSYFSRLEQQSIRLSAKVSVKKIVENGGQGHPDEDSGSSDDNGNGNGSSSSITDTWRGLENFTPENHRARKKRRETAIRAILTQQSKGPLNDKWLAQVYPQYTAPSLRKAYIRGFLDQQRDLQSTPFNEIMIR